MNALLLFYNFFSLFMVLNCMINLESTNRVREIEIDIISRQSVLGAQVIRGSVSLLLDSSLSD